MSNVNAVRNTGIKVDLGGQERVLKYDLNSFAELEDRYGSVDAAMNVLQEGTVKGIRTLLWCGLIHADENLTEKQVGAMITITDLPSLTESLTEAFTTALPSAKENIEKN